MGTQSTVTDKEFILLDKISLKTGQAALNLNLQQHTILSDKLIPHEMIELGVLYQKSNH